MGSGRSIDLIQRATCPRTFSHFRDDWTARGKYFIFKPNSSKVGGLTDHLWSDPSAEGAMADRSTGVFPGDGKTRGANNAPRIRFHD